MDLRLLFLVNEGPGATRCLGRADPDRGHRRQHRPRRPIWEHKVYRQRAPLVAGDGPINVLRRWARQFYKAAESTQEGEGDWVRTANRRTHIG